MNFHVFSCIFIGFHCIFHEFPTEQWRVLKKSLHISPRSWIKTYESKPNFPPEAAYPFTGAPIGEFVSYQANRENSEIIGGGEPLPPKLVLWPTLRSMGHPPKQIFLRLRRACFDPYFHLYFTFVFTIICTFKKNFLRLRRASFYAQFTFVFTFVFNCFLPSILPLLDIYFRFVFTLIFTFKKIFFACGGLVLILIFTFILLLFLPLFKKIFACGGLVFTLSLPLFLPLLLILCLPCILPLFDLSFQLYFTFVFTLVLFLTKHCFLPRNRDVRLPQEPAPARGGPASLSCFLPSIVTYQAAEAFACRRNQLLLAKWPFANQLLLAAIVVAYRPGRKSAG